ncbi:MAG: TonB-dependent receptor [Endomicrobiales bacterium]|nr:TonB-dependent receptor [Endomicrobiales bacterium]
MKNKIVALVVLVFGFGSAYSQESQENVFLSLTRRAESLREMPTSVSVIGKEKLKRSKAKDLGEAVENELGVIRGKYGSLGASSTLMIRGAGAEQVLVLVDGRRVNRISNGYAELSEIPLDAVEKIEIIRGPASAIYGTSAMGGVINVVTKGYDPSSPLFEAEVSGGSFNGRSLRAGMNVERNGLYGVVSASKKLSDGWRENSSYESQDLFVRTGRDFKKHGSFDLSGSIYSDEVGVPGQSVDLATLLPLSVDKYDGQAEKKASTSEATQRTSKKSVRLEHRIDVPRGKLDTTVYSRDEVMKYTVPSWFLDARYDSLVFGAETKYLMENGVTVGCEWWEEKYKQTDVAADLTALDRSRVNGSGYLQRKFKIGRFVLLPSLRYDDNSSFGSVFAPRIGVVYNATEKSKFSANAGRSWRSPTFNELYWPTETNAYSGITYVTMGNGDLKPEKSVSCDIGYAVEGENSSAGLTVFNSDTEDLINWEGSYDPATVTYTYMPQNITDVVHSGAEVNVKHKLTSWLAHEVSYNYLWAEDKINKVLLSYRPRNTAKYTLKYINGRGFRADADVKYTSRQNTENPSIPELEEYSVVDIRVTQKIKDVDVWAKAENVTDKKYQTRLGYPLPGAAYYAGVEIRFWE